MKYWQQLPQNIRTAIVGAVLIVIGAVTEWLVSVIEQLGSSPV